MNNIFKMKLELSKSLFWDVDYDTIDWDKHAPYVVERVINRGTLAEFKIIKNYYGKAKLKKITKQFRYMNDEVLHFCSVYFDTPITAFRCYTLKQSNPSHWDY